MTIGTIAIFIMGLICGALAITVMAMFLPDDDQAGDTEFSMFEGDDLADF